MQILRCAISIIPRCGRYKSYSEQPRVKTVEATVDPPVYLRSASLAVKRTGLSWGDADS